MDLLLIIGNAVADDEFRKQLFADPYGTVKRYGFRLTNAEIEGLNQLTRGDKAAQNQEYLDKLYTCPHRPCAYAIAPPDKPAPPEQKVSPIDRERTGTHN